MPLDSAPTVQCKDCLAVLGEDHRTLTEDLLPCPSCGSTARLVSISVSDTLTIGLRESLRVKARRPGPGKASIEVKMGDELHQESGTWRTVKRTVDRDRNQYHEVITDTATGKILVEKHERLSDHQGFGSAKRSGTKRLSGSRPVDLGDAT